MDRQPHLDSSRARCSDNREMKHLPRALPPFALVARDLLADPDTKAPDKLVYVLFAAHADKKRRSTFVSLSTLAGHLAKRDAAISASKRRLAERGWLSAERRARRDGRRGTDLCTLRDGTALRGEGTFGLAATAVMTDNRLTPGARVFYAALTCRATRDDRDLRWRTERSLAAYVGSKRRQSAGEWLGELERYGYVKVDREEGWHSRVVLLDSELLIAEPGTKSDEETSDYMDVNDETPDLGTECSVDGDGRTQNVWGPARRTVSEPARRNRGQEQTRGSDSGTHQDVVACGNGTPDATDATLEAVLATLGYDDPRLVASLIDGIEFHYAPRNTRAWMLQALANKCVDGGSTSTHTAWLTSAIAFGPRGSKAYTDARALVDWWWKWRVAEWDEDRDRTECIARVREAGLLDPEDPDEAFDLLRTAGIEWPGLYLRGAAERGAMGGGSFDSGVDEVLARLAA